jgi:NADH:ubiquinone oxidoreductase subunit 5 (subunit L)/multisubunit Na+/H+ antiporter MnhA subunit
MKTTSGITMRSMSGVLIAVPVLPLLAALLVLVLRSSPIVTARISVISSALSLVAAVAVLIVVAVDGPIDAVVTDDAGRAVLGFSADRVGGVLIALTALVGLVVQSFAARSLLADPRARRFHLLALVLTAATLSVAVAATATGLVVAWIVTSVSLVALIGHRAPWPPAVEAQRRTGASFLIGDIALVIAVIVALVAIGEIDMRSVGADALALDGEELFGVSALTLVALLMVLAGIARSALVPIHRWLPSTLAAPTPVSALLHAGVINGAGVLLIRFSPVFGSSATAMAVAFGIGTLTALVATAVMLVRTDVKGGLVWSTSGQMGFMVLQLGVGAFAAALFHIVGHALYKAAMFLGAGGAITALSRQNNRPHLGRADAAMLRSVPVRLTIGLLVPLVAFALALVVIDPHLTAAATILIVVFGTLSVGRAANGWLSATPFATVRSIVTAVVGVFVAVFGYVGGVTLFESFVADVVPYDVPAAVGPIWVVATLGLLAIAALTVAFTPGDRGDELRRRVYAWLLTTGASTPLGVDPRSNHAPSPRPVPASRSTSPEVAAAAVTVGEPA